jgi:hypoxanthine-DNA glycosylase
MARSSRASATTIRGFPPVARRGARVLVLGSMPGAASLAAGEYYAHPRNQFWRIVGELLDVDPAAPYARRTAALRRADIALWDVLASCRRPGSLDADIDERSIVVNPFADFLAAHPHIRRVCFNGARAEAAWCRHVLPVLPRDRELACLRLPSTSPAHAALTFRQKLRAWRALLD